MRRKMFTIMMTEHIMYNNELNFYSICIINLNAKVTLTGY